MDDMKIYNIILYTVPVILIVIVTIFILLKNEFKIQSIWWLNIIKKELAKFVVEKKV